MKQVEELLRDIARVGSEAIVSFLTLAIGRIVLRCCAAKCRSRNLCRMNGTDTPNVRCATIYDFADLAEDVGLTVTECVALHEGKQINWLPNLRE